MSLTIQRPTIPVPLPLARGGTEATNPAGARAKLELGDLAQLTAPGGTTTFLRADKTWAVPAGGGGGGDLSSNTALAVDSELVVFAGTTGKLVKRGTGSGLALLTNGVLSIKAAPTGAVVGTTDTQTLTGKTIAGASNTLTVREADLSLTDLTTADVSTARHGLLPKAPGGTTLFFRADATWAAPAGGGGGAPTDAEYITSTPHASLSAERVLTDTATITWDRATAGQIKATAVGGPTYTDEQAQDAIGAMLLDTATIDLTYTDATPSLSASVIDGSITEAKLSLSDVTTRDASTTAHGLLRKLSGTATEYLNGSGAWTTPAGGGGGTNYWTRTEGGAPSLTTECMAFWKLEEATGNRLDSVGSNHLVPQGTVATITNAAGKIGQALSMNATAGTYLSVVDNAPLSAGPDMSFTVACWAYVSNPTTSKGLVGKGSGVVNNNSVEYMLWQNLSTWSFLVGGGASFVEVVSPTAPVASTWALLIGWYDHVADIQYLQVNNGTPAQVANAVGSHDSTLPFEMGHVPGVTSSLTLNGRIDMAGFWRRVLTPQERADLWNSGNGLEYPFGIFTASVLTPATATDRLVLAVTPTTQERVEVDGGIKVGNSTGTVDGIVRWNGTDMEARKGGAWVSLTATGSGGGGDLSSDTAVSVDSELAVFSGTSGKLLKRGAGTGLALLTSGVLSMKAAPTGAVVGTTDTQTLTGKTIAGASNTLTVREADLSFTDIATANVSLTAHGLTPKAPGGTTQFLRGDATWAVPPATGQPLDATLTALAGLATGANQLPYAIGTDAFSQTTLSAFARTLLDDADAATMHGTLALGTMAQQDASAVAITGGAATGLSTVQTMLVGVGRASDPGVRIYLSYNKDTEFGLVCAPTVNDSGFTKPLLFKNVAGTDVGSIDTTATATAYNTSSDVRLKECIETLVGALDVVRALRPVSFRWQADGSQGNGFLAHELMQAIPEAVSGLPDEVHEDGSVKPQQVDHSRLVPWLTAALRETLETIDALAARVASLETQLGV